MVTIGIPGILRLRRRMRSGSLGMTIGTFVSLWKNASAALQKKSQIFIDTGGPPYA
jgi:hypothetical protein